jgi:hypothetical protein
MPQVDVITHGDIDGLMCVALWILNENRGKWPRIDYHLPSDNFDAKDAIVMDIACDRGNPTRSMAMLDECSIWYDHHEGWPRDHPRLVQGLADSCAEQMWQANNYSVGRELVEVANECDKGFPSSDLALIFHQTIKTNFVSRSIKDLIILVAIGKADASVLYPYVADYAGVKHETDTLEKTTIECGSVAFINASTPNIYDKSALLSKLCEKKKVAVVISRRGAEFSTTVSTNDKTLNLCHALKTTGGSSRRVTLKGNRLIEMLQIFG